MPTFRITAPDGKTYDVTGPDGSTAEEALARVKSSVGVASAPEAKPERTLLQRTGDDVAGLVAGAGDIGSTLIELARSGEANPFSTLGARVDARKAGIRGGLEQLGADPESMAYKAGRIGGNIAGTAGIPVGGGNLLVQAGKGALAGGVGAGLVDPNAAVAGGLIGGALPVIGSPVAALSKWGVNKLQGVGDLFLTSGAERILDRYTNKIVGKANIPAVVAAAKNAPDIIPNGAPTLAQATAGIPEASPLGALEAITAKTYGGPSKAFGARKLEQEAALEAAATMRDAVAAPMRSAALTGAKAGGVKSAPVIAQVDALATTEGYRASDVVTKTLGHIRNKLESLTDDATGVINPADLYTVRKEIGSTIQQFSKETANWDKGLTAKLERQLQLSIDDAIENAGGRGWKDYLSEYAKRSKAIEDYTARRELAANPLQKTRLSGGINIADETRTHLPNMLSRPMMLINAASKALGRNIETQIDAIAAIRHLNPQEFVKAMEKVPVAQRNVLKDAWLAARNPMAVGGALATSDSQ
jgi:hypothetical protein